MSNKLLQQPALRYRYPSLVSPFSSEGQQWDRPIGQVRELTRRFRVLSLTFLLVGLALLVECAVQLNKKMPDLWVLERVSGTFINRVGRLPFDEKRYREICPQGILDNRCANHAT